MDAELAPACAAPAVAPDDVCRAVLRALNVPAFLHRGEELLCGNEALGRLLGLQDERLRTMRPEDLVTEELRAMTIERASTGQMRRKAIEQGMHSLREDGWRLVKEGKTTIEEVVRNTKEEQVTRATEDVVNALNGSPMA